MVFDLLQGFLIRLSWLSLTKWISDLVKVKWIPNQEDMQGNTSIRPNIASLTIFVSCEISIRLETSITDLFSTRKQKIDHLHSRNCKDILRHIFVECIQHPIKYHAKDSLLYTPQTNTLLASTLHTQNPTILIVLMHHRELKVLLLESGKSSC